MYSMLDCFQKV